MKKTLLVVLATLMFSGFANADCPDGSCGAGTSNNYFGGSQSNSQASADNSSRISNMNSATMVNPISVGSAPVAYLGNSINGISCASDYVRADAGVSRAWMDNGNGFDDRNYDTGAYGAGVGVGYVGVMDNGTCMQAQKTQLRIIQRDEAIGGHVACLKMVKSLQEMNIPVPQDLFASWDGLEHCPTILRGIMAQPQLVVNAPANIKPDVNAMRLAQMQNQVQPQQRQEYYPPMPQGRVEAVVQAPAKVESDYGDFEIYVQRTFSPCEDCENKTVETLKKHFEPKGKVVELRKTQDGKVHHIYVTGYNRKSVAADDAWAMKKELGIPYLNVKEAKK